MRRLAPQDPSPQNEQTMTSPTRRPARARRFAATAATIGLGALAFAPLAHAEDPTSRELLDQCNNGTDSCVFHPDGAPSTFPGERKQVGRSDYNCTSVQQSYAVAWSDMTQESNSVGVSFSVEAGFGEVFKVSMETNYSHTWTSGHTETETTTVNVPPGEVGEIYHAPEMQRASGQYELHFGDRFHDHYIWYVPFESTSPTDSAGTVTQSTRPMTDEEKAQCPSA
jgi:hypothetical protein